MHSLFLKIFLWFWLAMALVILAGFLSAVATFREDGRGPGGPHHSTMYAATTAEKREREGQATANDYLTLLERTTRTRAYLFDHTGKQVAGPAVPPEVEAFSQRPGNERDSRPTPSGDGQTEI